MIKTAEEFLASVKTMRKGFGPGDHEIGSVNLSVLEMIADHVANAEKDAKAAEEKAEGEFAIGSGYHRKWQKAEKQLEESEKKREALHKTCGELLQAAIEADGSITWSKQECKNCTDVEKRAEAAKRVVMFARFLGSTKHGAMTPDEFTDCGMKLTQALEEYDALKKG